MHKNKYRDKLEALLIKPFFTIEDAKNESIPRHVIAYWHKRGILERLYPGVYRSAFYEPQVEFGWEKLSLITASIPKGIICLISALCYYDLTDQIMREAWVAIPHTQRVPKRSNAHIVRMRDIQLGREKITIGEYSVYIFNRERTIIDAFRYLSKEIALKALKRYFFTSTKKPDIKLLVQYAKILRVDITPYILSYTT